MGKGQYKYIRSEYTINFVADVLSCILDTFVMDEELHDRLVECRDYAWKRLPEPLDDCDFCGTYCVSRYKRRAIKRG